MNYSEIIKAKLADNTAIARYAIDTGQTQKCAVVTFKSMAALERYGPQAVSALTFLDTYANLPEKPYIDTILKSGMLPVLVRLHFDGDVKFYSQICSYKLD